jgi:hypothetical protein
LRELDEKASVVKTKSPRGGHGHLELETLVQRREGERTDYLHRL